MIDEAPEFGAPPLAEPGDRDPDFSRGLLTAVVQDAGTGQVLMVAHMNEEAYAGDAPGAAGRPSSAAAGGRLWEKGETSGNSMRVPRVRLDCDGDAVLLRVDPRGPACHTGEPFVLRPAGRGRAAGRRAPNPTTG